MRRFHAGASALLSAEIIGLSRRIFVKAVGIGNLVGIEELCECALVIESSQVAV